MLKNKSFKRIIGCILVGILMCTTIMGCGASSSKGSGGASGAGAKILFLIPDVNDTFRNTLAEAIKAAASQQGVTLDYVETGGSVEFEANQVAGAKAAGYDAIILRPADGSTALQMNVASNGLPIIYVNNQPADEHLTANKYIYVGSNESDAGRYQGEYVLQKLGNPKSLNVIIFQGEAGHSATIARTASVKKALKDGGCNANYVFVDSANWSDVEAREKFAIFMKTGQSVDAIFCNNDTMALGAVEGLKDFGLDYTKIPVTGVDATADGCASILAGEMAFTVLQDAKGQGAAAVQAAAVLGKGGDLSSVEGVSEDKKFVWVPFAPVDKSNAASIN
ncbi:substrate-binding domain-containing protein [Butyrivibrio sp. AE2032]|uniref:substrate-binding domain-containing protein n=1 Tax=Butyrivibrio sp. AE2032 TaxID=1458463 RepID=UPI000550D9A4|nr:substrate-binding domain-containing protein [Butyrivibrio sp. AE2032]